MAAVAVPERMKEVEIATRIVESFKNREPATNSTFQMPDGTYIPHPEGEMYIKACMILDAYMTTSVIFKKE